MCCDGEDTHNRQDGVAAAVYFLGVGGSGDFDRAYVCGHVAPMYASRATSTAISDPPLDLLLRHVTTVPSPSSWPSKRSALQHETASAALDNQTDWRMYALSVYVRFMPP